MSVLPVPFLISLLLGILSLFALVWSLATVWRIFRGARRQRVIDYPRSGERIPAQPVVRRESRLSRHDRKLLAVAGVVLLFSLAGRPLVLLFKHSGGDDPRSSRSGGRFITRPDGTRLYVETTGSPDAPVLVLTHGWGLDADLWYYAKRDLSRDFRLITWDLPGLGQSTQPANRDYSLEKMADDLEAVLATAGRPAVLVGHSIGGMINLTFCRRHRAELGRSVAGIVQMNTTYTDPTRTTKNAGLAKALEKPVAEPLLYLTIALSPLVRAMNALRYWNGMSHLQNASQSFAGTESREQLDFVARYDVKASPAVVARGTLAMFHWDGSAALRDVSVPVLLIAGDRDTTTVPAASAHMRDKLKQSDLLLAGPAKHLGVIEQNRQYNDSVRAFANACFGPRASQSARLQTTPAR